MATSECTVEVHKIHFEAFLKVSAAATSSSNVNIGSYGSAGSSTTPKEGTRPLKSYSLKELTISPIFMFVNVPGCRQATLEFFGAIIREHAAIYVSILENPGAGIDYGNLDDALHEIETSIKQDLQEKGGKWCLEIFEWCLETLAEISKKNSIRRVFSGPGASSGGGDVALSDILRMYTSCRSTRLLLELLNECVGLLLAASPERCIAGLLGTTARFGNYCDWILTFIGLKYPKTIIDQLLTIGSADFYNFVTEMMSKQSTMELKSIISKHDQYHREKLASLSSILGHLAHQQGAELRRQLAAIIQEGFLENANQRQQYALIFVIKAASLSKDVADLLLQDLHHLVTVSNIATIIRIFGQIPQVIVFGNQQPAHVLINTIMALKEITMSLLYDKLLHLAFDNLQVEKQDPKTIQQYAYKILERLMTEMEGHVNNNVTFTPESTPLLNEIDGNLPLAFKRLFSSNTGQKNYYFKCLTLLCFVRGEKKTIQILANVLFRAVNEQQLSIFVCFCRILHPVHRRAIENLFVNLPQHYESYRESGTPAWKKEILENEWGWLDNFKWLVQWDQATCETNLMSLTEIILNNYAVIVEYLLPLIRVESCSRPVLDILMKVGHPVHLQPQTVVRLVNKCCSLILDIFGDLDAVERLELHKTFTEYLVMFVQSQTPYSIEMAMRILLATVLQQREDDGNEKHPLCNVFDTLALSAADIVEDVDKEEAEIHGATTSMADMEKNIETQKSSSAKRRLFTSTSTPLLAEIHDPKELSGNGAVEKGSFTPLNLVHSGVIKGKFARHQLHDVGKNMETPKKSILCKLAFVRMIDRLCCVARGPSTGASAASSLASAASHYNLDTCRMLATLLNEHLCPDAIAADHCLDDWETSKSSMERYLMISKRMDEVPFSWDLLTIASEAYPCLWFCLPIVKAMLGSAIAQCENAIDKTVNMPQKLLKTLEKIFLVMVKGRLVSEPLAYAIDLLPHVKQFEGACVLIEIWRYIQSIAPDAKSLQHHFECIQCDFGGQVEAIKGDQMKHLEPLLLVLQANIASAGYLLEKFVDLSDLEDMHADA